ncbi:MAG: GTPase Era [Acidimicrobiia bacterium]|nr:GTPase Era [Acidimicrobiia bacterium]
MSGPGPGAGAGDTPFRSGFVTLVGRPNVGKSTLLNRLVGTKVSIVSDRPQTTRNEIRGVRTTTGSQIVFLDTPGIHRPRTPLGERTNQRALATLAEVDVVAFLVEAHAPIGRGDRFIADLVHGAGTPAILVVNKVDLATRAQVVDHLGRAAGLLGDFDAYVPVSAATGDGVDALLGELEARMPEGPRYYPEGVVTDQPETFLAAELVREKLLATAREELPHSITVSVEELESAEEEPAAGEPGRARGDLLRLRAVIRVERDSQKAIVIGRRGENLRRAGTEARHELEALLGCRVHLETFVKVERGWQRRSHLLDRLGY